MGLARNIAVALLAVSALWFAPEPTSAQAGASAWARVAADTPSALREWDRVVGQLERSGELRARPRRADTLLPQRQHERLDQYFKGVRVFGADLARQTEGGVPVSLFGVMYQNISIDTTPQLSEDEARHLVAERSGSALPANLAPELIILPQDGGTYALAYRARVFADGVPIVYFIDANSGESLLEYSDLQTQSALGTGKGVLGDDKKLSVIRDGSMFHASDKQRPPALFTFDMRGSVTRTMSFLNGVARLSQADLASDADDNWTDPASVDAHAYTGWVYDYYFKRFGRRGLDNNDIAIASLVHPANRQEVLRQPSSIVGLLYTNAAYVGGGVMVYGEGLPSGLTDSRGRSWNYTSGGLDVIAHELTHGVTEFSSRLIYLNESGALNEAFSDVMGVSAEFFHQPVGSGPLRADYLMGEDIVTPGGLRSLSNPADLGDPDHYTRRYRGSSDNGGVHTNSTIASHAFYLAIEGGTHRTSGVSVAGVGSDNREQIERVFYRAFAQLMPSNANFSTARAVTIQAARDLYGAGSPAERAVTQAWAAVGVQ